MEKKSKGRSQKEFSRENNFTVSKQRMDSGAMLPRVGPSDITENDIYDFLMHRVYYVKSSLYVKNADSKTTFLENTVV